MAGRINRTARALAFVLLLTVAPLWEAAHGTSLASLTNSDFWWHLSAGLGIVAQHAVPHSGWFSQSSAQPWSDSSWLYDVLVALGYKALNLRVLPLLAMLCKFALAVVTFALAGGLRGKFWTAVALSAITQYALGGMQPLPVFCSVLAFGAELAFLSAFKRDPQMRAFWLLPAVFLVWANLDYHFVYGILPLLWFAAICVAENTPAVQRSSWLPLNFHSTPLRVVLGISAASLLATFTTPYGWNGYATFWASATSAANPYFPDFLSLRFRTPQDYVLMLLAMGAFLSLGTSRSRDLFQLGLLMACIAAAFHSQRDTWLLGIAAIAVIGEALPIETAAALSYRRRTPLAVAAVVSVAILLAYAAVRLPSREALMAKVGESYPVAAADYIRRNNLPAPLFNAFPWGGFLTWYLPQYPVAIDGRTGLYGADMNVQYAKVMNFEAHYSTFPRLNDAGTILLDKNSSAGKALPSARGFKKAYEDGVAVVLLRDRTD